MTVAAVTSRARSLGRRATLGLLLGSAITSWAGLSPAEDAYVSPEVQATLLAKVASYDRNFAARAIDRAKILLVTRGDDPDSVREVAEMGAALASIAAVGGLPHGEEVTTFTSAAAIAQMCSSHRIAIVYFGPGLSEQIPAIRTALTSVDVLSVAAVPDYVQQGVVLGFEVVSGAPRLLLHLGQARAQNIHFGARILKRMKIYG
jgi:hypothetical protein